MSDKKKIYQDMMKDEKAIDLLKASKKPESIDEMAEVLGGVALSTGYPLSKEDFIVIYRDIKEDRDKRVLAATKTVKLADDELSTVAGGKDHAECSDTFENYENCFFEDGCDIVINDYKYYYCSYQTNKLPCEYKQGH